MSVGSWHRVLGQRYVWILALVAVLIFLSSLLCYPVPVEGNYHFGVVQPNCMIVNNESVLEVTYVATVICHGGSIDIVNFTMPYGDREIIVGEARPWSEDLHGRENLTTKTLQQRSETAISVSLPMRLTKGLSFSLILRYTIHDLPGDRGVARKVRTLSDWILGRGPSRIKVRYRPAILEAQVDNLNVRMYPPKEGDLHILDWRPANGRLLGGPLGGPSDGKESVYWSPVRNPKSPEYRVLLGKVPLLGQMHPYLKLSLSISALLVIVTAFIHLVNKRLKAEEKRRGRLRASLGVVDIVLVMGLAIAIIAGFVQETAPSMDRLLVSLTWSAISVVGVVIALLGAAVEVPRRVRLSAGTVLLIVALIAMWVGSWFFDLYPVHSWDNMVPVLVFGLGTAYLILYAPVKKRMI